MRRLLSRESQVRQGTTVVPAVWQYEHLLQLLSFDEVGLLPWNELDIKQLTRL